MILEVGDRSIELVEKIGDGGTGEVFRGHDRKTGEQIALKVIHKRFADNPEFRQRYSREARALGQLAHPSFTRILGEGALNDGRVYLMMELVTGHQASALRSTAPSKPHRVLKLFVEVANALQQAHDVGIVHRDLKPENLVLEQKNGVDRLRILDFGFVRFDERHDATDLTQQGIVLGTVGFMSVEQLSGLAVDGRADIYSLAVCIYETWCGELPFRAKNAMELFRAQSNGELVALEERLPNDAFARKLSPVLTRALARDRESRTPTMAAFAAELSELLPVRPDRPASTKQRSLTKAGLAGLGFLVGIAITAVVSTILYFSSRHH